MPKKERARKLPKQNQSPKIEIAPAERQQSGHRKWLPPILGFCAAMLIGGAFNWLPPAPYPIAYLLFGIGALCLVWLGVVQIRLTHIRILGLILALIISFITGCFVYASWNPILEPEDARNKFVRETPIATPFVGQGKNALLIEFGVTRLDTDGISIGIRTNSKVKYCVDWAGLPGKTHQQILFRNRGNRGFLNILGDGFVIHSYIQDAHITPRHS